VKIKRPKQAFPLVEVIWDDASTLAGTWKSKEEFEKELLTPQLMLSYGFLIKETDDYIVIAMDLDNEGGHASRSQIPKGMVKKMRVIRKADSVKESSNTSTNHSSDSTTLS
jgi:hypothetical protein